jgi:small subunit ribosomal protein S7
MRHAKVQKRQIDPDKIYNNLHVAKLMNRIMIDGKKTIAENIVYGALQQIEKQNQTPLEVLDKALQNIAPKVEVKARRVGGASYQVPIEVRPERRSSLALRWLVEAARKRPNKEFKSFTDKLAAELMAAANNEGEAIKKKEVMHRQAEANRAFAQFRW